MSMSMKDLEKATQEAISNSEVKKKRKFVESIDVIINLKNVNLKDPNKRRNWAAVNRACIEIARKMR